VPLLTCPAGYLSFIPGPALLLGTTQSTSLSTAAEYDPALIVAGMLSHPGVTASAGSSILRWTAHDRWIESEVASDDASVWSGSPLEMSCNFSDLLSLWLSVLRGCSAVWLHDEECTMFSPSTYCDAFVRPRVAKLLGPVAVDAARDLRECQALLSGTR